MNDETDHPVSDGLEAVRRAAPDPRLERWAAGTLPEAEREALRRDAETDADLAAQLERLAPLDDGMREAMFAEAMAALAAPPAPPRAQVVPLFRRGRILGVAVAVAALAAGVVAFVASSGSASFEVLERPSAGQTFDANDAVALTLRSSAASDAFGVFVSERGRARRVELAWDVRGDRMTVEAPAHLFTAGHFGAVELAVGPAHPSSIDALGSSAYVRLPLVVRTPTYTLREAVAALADPQRSADDIIDGPAVVIPDGAIQISLTLRPEVTVRSGVQACAFIDGPAGLRPIDAPCATFDTGLVRLPVDVSDVPAGEDGAVSVVAVIGPAQGEMTVEGARAAVGAPADARGWRVVRVPLRRRAAAPTP